MILTGYGINAEKELIWAFEKAGGVVDSVHLEDLIADKGMLDNYQIIGFPGGFSFGDHITSGRVFANIVRYKLLEEIKAFIEAGKLIIGICNGFQIITKLGLVPDTGGRLEQTVSLVENDSARFEDRWVWVDNPGSESPWLKGIKRLYLPVRHGEGKFITTDPVVMEELKSGNQVAFKYVNPDGQTVYPFDPNGSHDHIAGITNRQGTVLGLMPHPEAYIFKENHPRWTEGIEDELTGLSIFENGINYFKQ
jgi:phosphoribosylformylglycinamidine synthase I